jgi:hypothetical protein
MRKLGLLVAIPMVLALAGTTTVTHANTIRTFKTVNQHVAPTLVKQIVSCDGVQQCDDSGYTIVAFTGDEFYVGPNGVPTYGYAEADSYEALNSGTPDLVRYECDQYIGPGVTKYAYVDSFVDDVSINPTSNAGVTDSSDSPYPAFDDSSNVYSFMKVTATDYDSGDTAYVRGGMRDDNPDFQINSGAYGITFVGTIYTPADNTDTTTTQNGTLSCVAGGPPGPGTGGVRGDGGYGYAVDYYNPCVDYLNNA